MQYVFVLMSHSTDEYDRASLTRQHFNATRHFLPRMVSLLIPVGFI